jgi:hypothetical protein
MEKTPEIIESTETAENDIFIFLVHGFAPEFSDGLVFRKDKSYKPKRTKDVICPYCGNFLEKVDINTKIEVFRCSKKTAVDYHKSRQCNICRGIVAIKYVL